MPAHISGLLVAPFAILLACIAILPLAASHFWESDRNKALVAGALSVPVVIWLLMNEPAGLAHTAHEYVSFVILLGSLYTISGGIHFAGDLRATPSTNTAMLALGAVLANVVGTTGASMLLIRSMLRTNKERRNTAHLPFFFILIVSNCGGLLTPLGDPPLFLGFLRGVPFFWTLKLFPVWLGSIAYLLAVFYITDRRAYAAETARDLAEDVRQAEPLRVVGAVSLVPLAGTLGAVFLPSPWREIVMVAMGALSVWWGSAEARELNLFGWGPIREVAILFAGIFVTMVPALELLHTHGAELGLSEPWQFFWATGSLSSMLDNAPTYLAFFSAAQGLGLEPEVVGMPVRYLEAISCGAVLMGANSYIGNGPNFMVKAIAEESGYPMASFFGYAVKAVVVLMPVYLALTFFFTR